MKPVKLSQLSADAQATAAVIDGSAGQMTWTDRVAAGEKVGTQKTGIAAWTTSLPAGAKEGIKNPPREN